jgi:thiamine pyrophosphokinase
VVAVVAADSGYERAAAAGFAVDLVVGDLDSVSPVARGEIELRGIAFESYPADKDATDLELALDAALRYTPRAITVIGGRTGRFDHAIGEVLLLGHRKFAEVEIDAYLDDGLVQVVHGERTLYGAAGETISLLPVHGDARGVTTEGLLYTLSDDVLAGGSTRGVSNEFVSDRATISVRDGVVIAVRPRGLPAA